MMAGEVSDDAPHNPPRSVTHGEFAESDESAQERFTGLRIPFKKEELLEARTDDLRVLAKKSVQV